MTNMAEITDGFDVLKSQGASKL